MDRKNHIMYMYMYLYYMYVHVHVHVCVSYCKSMSRRRGNRRDWRGSDWRGRDNCKERQRRGRDSCREKERSGTNRSVLSYMYSTCTYSNIYKRIVKAGCRLVAIAQVVEH